MKRMMLLFLALLLCLLPLGGLAEGGAPTVTVTGSATVSATADYAVVSLGVDTFNQAVSVAMKENAAHIDAVLAALKNAGIDEKDIVTDRFYVYTQYDYGTYNEDGGNPVRGYQVSNALSVTVREISAVGSVIDTAISAGANACNGIAFYSSQAGSANDEALAAAIAEGRRKADLSAQAAGMRLGNLVSVTESSGSYNGVRYAKTAVADAGGTQIIADGLDFSASVVLIYELR